MDLDEFFISGEPEFSDVDAAGSSDEGPKTRLLHDVDHSLLESQFVTTKRHPDRHWCVKEMLSHGHAEFG